MTGDWEDRALSCIMAFVGLLLGYTIVFGFVIFTSENTCLAHGYKAANVTVSFHRYCTKRVRGTDVVTPFADVQP